MKTRPIGFKFLSAVLLGLAVAAGSASASSYSYSRHYHYHPYQQSYQSPQVVIINHQGYRPQHHSGSVHRPAPGYGYHQPPRHYHHHHYHAPRREVVYVETRPLSTREVAVAAGTIVGLHWLFTR